MYQRYFQNEFRGYVEVVRIMAVCGQHERQDVPSRSRTSPSQTNADLGELCVDGVAQDGSVLLSIAGVADELGIPHAIVVTAVRALGKYRDG